MSDYLNFSEGVVSVIGVIVLAIAFAWALLVRRGRDGRLKPSIEAIEPDPDAVQHGRALHWQDVANAALGVWLFASPWVLGFGLDAHDLWIDANAWVVGALVFMVALAALYNDHSLWQRINLTLGIWIFASPWIYSFVDKSAAAWDHWIVGFLVVIFAGWDLAFIRGTSTRRRHVTRPETRT
jgi:hypothetical protein